MVGDSAPKRFRLIIDGLAILIIVSLLMSAYLFYDRITTSREAQHNTVQAIRTVLCFAQSRTLNDPHVTDKQKRRSVLFYTLALRKINGEPCPPLKRLAQTDSRSN